MVHVIIALIIVNERTSFDFLPCQQDACCFNSVKAAVIACEIDTPTPQVPLSFIPDDGRHGGHGGLPHPRARVAAPVQSVVRHARQEAGAHRQQGRQPHGQGGGGGRVVAAGGGVWKGEGSREKVLGYF